METTDQSSERVSRTLEQEFGLIRDAITLVASGGAQRVTVASLRFGDELLDAARRMAAKAGVRIVPLWSADERGTDILVERDVDA
jgi:hypothetical protein